MTIGKSVRHFFVGLVLTDVVAWSTAFACAYWLRVPGPFPAIETDYLTVFPYVLLAMFLGYQIVGLYHETLPRGQEAVRIIQAEVLSLMLLLAASFFYRGFSFSRLIASYYAVLVLLLDLAFRSVYRILIRDIFRSFRWRRPILVIGCGKIAQRLIPELLKNDTEYDLVGFVDDDEAWQGRDWAGAPCLGKIGDLKRIVTDHDVSEVIIAIPSAPFQLHRQIMDFCLENDLIYRFVPRMYETALHEFRVEILGDIPLISLKGSRLTGFNYLFKRAFDLTFATIGLVVLSPLMAAVAVSIKAISPGPVLYRQKRIGYRKAPFNMLKFRSMKLNSDERAHREFVRKWINGEDQAGDAGATVHKIQADPRVIPVVGRIIRRFSIDEIPQLFNVIKGDMSLIGPRPCLEYELDLFQPWHRARFNATPGMTGLWQVSGRNTLTFEEMVKLDIEYLENWNFLQDLYILVKTPLVLFLHKGY